MWTASACQEGLSSRELVSLSVTVSPSLSQSCKSRIITVDELASFYRTGRIRRVFMMSEQVETNDKQGVTSATLQCLFLVGFTCCSKMSTSACHA
jgi:hypothetical protein